MTDNAHDTDPVTGTKTTGHIWDGIQELNTPLPRWWLWTFYATIIWSVGYWIVYPSWPLVNTYTRGLTNWHARDGIISDLADLKRKRGPLFEKLGSASLSDIRNDPQLSEFARAVGRPAFAENCSPCHGAGGGGAKGYPNLNDDDWLWGGKLEEIAQTVRHGIRSGDAASRPAVAMPAFGRDGMLKRTEIETIADYVRSLAGLGDGQVDLAAGKKLYGDFCAGCHGPDAKGNRSLGVPNLADRISLYGSERAAVID